MAISPLQLQEAFQKEVEAYEEAIDKKLANQNLTSGQSLTLTPPSSMTSKHFDFLRLRYINVGWKDVLYNDDQREGVWLTFKS